MSVADRFNWATGGIEITKGDPTPEVEQKDANYGLEYKGGQRTVKDPDYWGLPYGTPIVAGMKPKPVKKGGKKTPSVSSTRKTGGTGKTTAARPTTTVTPKRALPNAKDRATGLLRAWGELEGDPGFRRKNVRNTQDYRIEYATPQELKKTRKIAADRAKVAPKPDKATVARNKYLLKTNNLDIRGDTYMRSQRSWDMYVAYGGVDNKTGKDKGYVPCIGCGVKMSWHDDRSLTQFPKFEQDKVITTEDGGSYNTQNCVPSCAKCNNQRGSTNLWDSAAFPNSKPAWYTPAFQKMVATTRPSASTTNVFRPISENADWYMPVPPGKERGPRGIKSAAFDRANDMWLVTDPTKNAGAPTNGDRVRAHLFNYDGRYNTGEVFAPDVDDPNAIVVGRLIIEIVESAFGEYTRHVVIEDDGRYVFVEEDSIEKVAGSPDYEDPRTFDEDSDRSSHSLHPDRVLHSRSSKRHPFLQDSVQDRIRRMEIKELIEEFETKGKRFVRSAEGAIRYGKPIGSLITAQDRQRLRAKRKASRTLMPKPNQDRAWAGKQPTGRDDIRVGAMKRKPSARHASAFAKRAGKTRPTATEQMESGGQRYYIAGPQMVRINRAWGGGPDRAYEATFTHKGKTGNPLDTKVFTGKSMQAVFDAAADYGQLKHNRLTKTGTDYDEQGNWHVNRRKRDFPGLMEHWEGVRGIDWSYEDDDVEDTYEARMALIEKEAGELGYSWGSENMENHYPGSKSHTLLDPWAMELTNAVMRAHDTKFPGMAKMYQGIVASDNAVAWNGQHYRANSGSTSEGIYRVFYTLGMNPKFWGYEDPDVEVSEQMRQREMLLKSTQRDKDHRLAQFAVNAPQFAEEEGLDEHAAVLMEIMTHELGHTIGYVLQDRMHQNQRVNNESYEGYVARGGRGQGGITPAEDNAAKYYRAQLMDLLFEYNIMHKDIEDSDAANDAFNNDKANVTYFNTEAITEHVSKYGATNMAELFAETWAAYMLDPEPGDFVRELGSLMEEAMEMFMSEQEQL